MPKAMKKYSNKNQFPAPKRGKHRANQKVMASTSGKKMKPVPYVRHRPALKKFRKARQKWSLSVRTLAGKKGLQLIQTLKKERLLGEWKGRARPHCGDGILGSLSYVKNRQVWAHRCPKKDCQKFVQPHNFHPIFFGGSGPHFTSLADQASALCCALAGVPVTSAPLVLGLDHKPVERIYQNLEMARSKHVVQTQKKIRFGSMVDWPDVEADEVDLGHDKVEPDSGKKISWEQWGGIVERGQPQTLMLFRLKPAATKPRAPGPGAIRKRDWAPIAQKHLANRNVVLHTDGARAYKLKLPGVLHWAARFWIEHLQVPSASKLP